MPGITIGGTPKWIRNFDGAYTTYDMDEILKMKAAVEADRIACGKGQPCSDIPHHNTGYYSTASGRKTVRRGEGTTSFNQTPHAITYRCPSFSRWYNPNTGEMEGHAHCTCDYCF